jgi:hypothetical protein
MADITLDFIAKQLERVLAEQSSMRDELLVTNARIGYVETSLERIEASIMVLTLEMRAMRNQASRLGDRVAKLEATP